MMRTLLRCLLGCGLLSAASGMAQDLPADTAGQAPRHVILIIGDGMDEQQVTIARNYLKGAAGRLLLDQMPLRSAEARALRDKAFTASGFAQLAAGDFQQARGDFSQVRLESPLSERALLGYGWASGQTGDYLEALSPWQALSENSSGG